MVRVLCSSYIDLIIVYRVTQHVTRVATWRQIFTYAAKSAQRKQKNTRRTVGTAKWYATCHVSVLLCGKTQNNLKRHRLSKSFAMRAAMPANRPNGNGRRLMFAKFWHPIQKYARCHHQAVKIREAYQFDHHLLQHMSKMISKRTSKTSFSESKISNMI